MQGRFLFVIGVAVAFGGAGGCAKSTVQHTAGILKVTAIPDFGHVMLGRSLAYRVQVQDLGRPPLDITAVQIGGGMHDYAIKGEVPKELASTKMSAFDVVFAPEVIGPRDTQLTLANDGSIPDKTFPLTGVGILGEATFDPKSLDFGDVGLGSTSTLPITFTSSPDDPAAFTISTPTGPDAAAFVDTPHGAIEMQPGETTTVNVTFAPQRMGAHSASLTVQPCPSCPTVDVPIIGNGIAADLTVDPDSLDFGVVEPLQSVTLSVTVTNWGTAAATIDPAVIAPGAGAGFAVISPQVYTLLQNESATISVSFSPMQTGIVTGQLRFGTSDTGTPMINVPLSGTGAGCAIEVDPTALGFPRTGVGLTVTKQIAVRNVGLDPTGTHPCVISSITSAGAPFTAAARAPLPITLPVGNELYVDVTYDATTAGSFTGTVTIGSNDPIRPTVPVPVTASASALPNCTYVVKPTALDFGSVASGNTATLYFGIQNTGTTECAVANIALTSGTPPEFQFSPISTRMIDPGQTLQFPVTFAPDRDSSWTGEVDFDVLSQAAPNGAVALSGNGVPGCFSVVPQTLNFGTVGLSCAGPTRTVQLANACAVTVHVTSSTIGTGPSAAFSVVAGQGGPLTLAPGAQAVVGVTYAPTVAGSDNNALYVATDFQPSPYLVALTGAAAAMVDNTDTFTIPPMQKVDVLWIIDNSGSMSNKQAELSANAATFINLAISSGVDFQIATTTTGVTPFTGGIVQCPGGANGGEAGRFYPVDASLPRILTPTTPNLAQVFAQDALVGICHYIEEGFTAMQLALSPPLITSAKAPGTPFPSDGNLGFLRPDARLYVVWVTDEDDVVADPSSPLGKSPNPVPVQTYVDFLYGLKPGRPDMVQVGAAIALPGSCGGNYDAVGARYMTLVGDFGGQIADICSPNWGSVIQGFANAAFQPQLVFPLTEAASGRTVDVQVNGVDIPATSASGQVNWRFDPTLGQYGAVVFDPSDPPAPGSTVTITYPVPCPPTP